MNARVEKGYITEMECGPNFAYVLSDNSVFSPTEYKVLQSQTDSCFVRCMKMLYNGKVQLYYLTESLKSFALMIPTLDADSFLTIVANLFSHIMDVKHNGFLSCQNIDLSFEHIYVDPTTYQVCLVYLPISKKLYDDNASFENEIRTGLVKLISGAATLASSETMQLASDLSNGTLTLEEIYSLVKGSRGIDTWKQDKRDTGSGMLRIIAMNVTARIEFVVNKDEFVIGKKAVLCDGVLGFNEMISRCHCKIMRTGNQFLIMDLQSTNGTYVNAVRLQPNQPYLIQNGDIIRLANSDFQVSMM